MDGKVFSWEPIFHSPAVLSNLFLHCLEAFFLCLWLLVNCSLHPCVRSNQQRRKRKSSWSLDIPYLPFSVYFSAPRKREANFDYPALIFQFHTTFSSTESPFPCPSSISFEHFPRVAEPAALAEVEPEGEQFEDLHQNHLSDSLLSLSRSINAMVPAINSFAF